MAQGWLAIRVELLGGGAAGTLWPPPGRDFAVNPAHTFAELAAAIDDAFARWDRAHLHLFDLPDGRLVADQVYLDEDPGDPPALADHIHRVGDVLTPGQEFRYTFDLGDNWAHRCTVTAGGLDPIDTLGIEPDKPLAFFGWGIVPDQYGRLWLGDDGETPPPPPPPELGTTSGSPDTVLAIIQHESTVVLPGLPDDEDEDQT